MLVMIAFLFVIFDMELCTPQAGDLDEDGNLNDAEEAFMFMNNCWCSTGHTCTYMNPLGIEEGGRPD